MNWQIVLANILVFIHVLFVGIVVLMVPAIFLGWWRGWRWVRQPWVRLIHLTMITIVVIETLCNVPCPLTVWERDLRLAGGQLHYALYDDGTRKETEDGHYILEANEQYDRDFIGRLLHNIIFLRNIPEAMLEVAYYCFGALVVLTLFLVPPRWKELWRKKTPST